VAAVEEEEVGERGRATTVEEASSSGVNGGGVEIAAGT
jgi:hypothetical protein